YFQHIVRLRAVMLGASPGSEHLIERTIRRVGDGQRLAQVCTSKVSGGLFRRQPQLTAGRLQSGLPGVASAAQAGTVQRHEGGGVFLGGQPAFAVNGVYQLLQSWAELVIR